MPDRAHVAGRGEPLGRRGVCGAVTHRPRHHALNDHIERQRLRLRPVQETSTTGFEADQAVARGRDADRPPAVVGMGEGHDPGSDECAAAAGGCTGRVIGVPRIAHRLVVAELGRGVETELGQPSLADDHHAAGSVLGGDRRVLLRRLGDEAGAAVVGRQPRDVGVVLGEGRHTSQRAEVVVGRCARPVVVADLVAVQLPVHRLDAGDGGLDEFTGTALTCADQLGEGDPRRAHRVRRR